MMTTKVTDHTSEIAKLIEKIAGVRVMAGVPSDDEQPHKAAGDLGTDARQDGKITNAALGAIHDRGAPEAGIPAHPWLLPGFELVQDVSLAHLETAGLALLEGDEPLFEQHLNQAGLVAVDGMRRTIELGIPPPLAPATLAARRRRGNSGTTPLLDTRQLYNSISYIIRRTS